MSEFRTKRQGVVFEVPFFTAHDGDYSGFRDLVLNQLASSLNMPQFVCLPSGYEFTEINEETVFYVQVTGRPAHWESSGESDEDLERLIGHIGIVIDEDEAMDLLLVRFPSHRVEGQTFQRWIESDLLEQLSQPTGLTQDQFELGGSDA